MLTDLVAAAGSKVNFRQHLVDKKHRRRTPRPVELLVSPAVSKSRGPVPAGSLFWGTIPHTVPSSNCFKMLESALSKPGRSWAPHCLISSQISSCCQGRLLFWVQIKYCSLCNPAPCFSSSSCELPSTTRTHNTTPLLPTRRRHQFLEVLHNPRLPNLVLWDVNLQPLSGFLRSNSSSYFRTQLTFPDAETYALCPPAEHSPFILCAVHLGGFLWKLAPINLGDFLVLFLWCFPFLCFLFFLSLLDWVSTGLPFILIFISFSSFTSLFYYFYFVLLKIFKRSSLCSILLPLVLRTL